MDSDGSTTDEGKRKRVKEDIAEIFKKSKKTGRSPDKGKYSNEEKLDKILEMIHELTTQVQQMDSKQDRHMEEIKTIKLENESIKKENEELKKEINNIKERLERIERGDRRKNVVIQGLSVDTTEQKNLKEDMENFIEKHLEIKVEIKEARKVGQKICLIVLNEMTDKLKIMKNKSKLRSYPKERIYINDDMTKEERAVQEKIRNKAREEKVKGKKVKIGFQKLTVEEQQWIWSREKGELVKRRDAEKPGEGMTKN